MLYQVNMFSSASTANKNPFAGISLLFRNLSPDTGIRTQYIQGRYSLPNPCNFPGVRRLSPPAPCLKDLPERKELFSTSGLTYCLSGRLLSKLVLIFQTLVFPGKTNDSPVSINVAHVIINATHIVINKTLIVINKTLIIINKRLIIINAAHIIINAAFIVINKTLIVINKPLIIINEVRVKTGNSTLKRKNIQIPKKNNHLGKHT